jgi:predicted transcriptional regulator YdeE
MSIATLNAENEFNVIGIGARTSNRVEFAGKGVISNLWQKLFAEQMLNKIPHKIDNAVVALYYNFENDKDGEYDILIGARVSSLDEVPEGMIGIHVPAEKRAVFVTEQGPQMQVVVGTWQKIWALEDQGKLNRTYQMDYELYDERSQDPAHAQVEIHIGVK